MNKRDIIQLLISEQSYKGTADYDFWLTCIRFDPRTLTWWLSGHIIDEDLVREMIEEESIIYDRNRMYDGVPMPTYIVNLDYFD